MNVLIMADYRTPNSGNFIASLLELALQMRQCGNGVCFLFPESRSGGGYTWSRWLEENEFRVYLMRDDLEDEQKIQQIQEIVRDHHVDLIHSHFGFCNRLLAIEKELGNVKILVHDHMGFFTDKNLLRQKLACAAKSAIYRKNGVGVAAVLESKAKSYILQNKERRWYVPNGVSMKRNLQVQLSREECRQAWGVSEQDKVCLLLGWDMYRKGVDIAVKAVNMLRQRGVNAKLAVVGFGTEPGQDQLDWIKARTDVDPKSEWILYLPSTEDIFAYHRAADVLLSASRSEGYPYTLLEAITQDTPIATSTIESVMFVKAYSGSVYYDTENVEACANAIEQALARGRTSNREELMEEFGIDRWCQRMMDIYKQMMK